MGKTMKNLGFCESMENLTILEVQKNMFTWKKPLKHLRKNIGFPATSMVSEVVALCPFIHFWDDVKDKYLDVNTQFSIE